MSVGLSVSRVFISVPSIHPIHFRANRECNTRGQCVNFIVRFISCVRRARTEHVNVGLKPSGHYTYRQFNIHKFYGLPTQLYLCVVCGSQNKQRLFPYTTLTDWFV